MNGRSLLTGFAGFLLCLSLSCGKKSGSVTNALKAVPVTNLVADVRAFALQAGAEEWTWEGKDSRLPKTVRTLAPIRVTLRKETSVSFVEIKLSGGFLPHGFLITCETNVAYTNKLYGNGWEVRPIADGIYEYSGF